MQKKKGAPRRSAPFSIITNRILLYDELTAEVAGLCTNHYSHNATIDAACIKATGHTKASCDHLAREVVDLNRLHAGEIAAEDEAAVFREFGSFIKK